MYVYLIRHAQSEDNLLNLSTRLTVSEYNSLLRHAPEALLTREGERQAQAMGGKLRPLRIERLYSSPYPRALATAKVMGQELELAVQVCDDLREVQPMLLKESQWAATLGQHFFRSYVRMLWPWGRHETWIKEYQRAQRIWAWIETEAVQNMALVSHGWFLRLLLLAGPRYHHWHILQRDFSNGGLSVLTNRIPVLHEPTFWSNKWPHA